MEKDSIKIIGELADGTGEDFETMVNIVADGLAAFGMSSQKGELLVKIQNSFTSVLTSQKK